MQTNGQSAHLPRKRFYIARAHSNPLSDSQFFFPCDKKDDRKSDASLPKIRFADNGYGFGALLVNLSTLFPDTLMIEMELRDKEKNHQRRVISLQLLDEYVYALEVGDIIYTITELGDWMRSCMEDHPLFEAIPDEELEADPAVKLLTSATEEGQKVCEKWRADISGYFQAHSIGGRLICCGCYTRKLVFPLWKCLFWQHFPRYYCYL